MQQQAIWKIENATPPRRISYGEAVAFCQVFGISVSELAAPPGEVLTAAFVHFVAETGLLVQDTSALLNRTVPLLRDISEVTRAAAPLLEYMGREKVAVPVGELPDTLANLTDVSLKLRDALIALSGGEDAER